jgi:hypothetical protein
MHDTDDNGPSGAIVLVCLAVSLGLFGLEAYVIHQMAPTLSAKGWGIAAAITVGYLLVAQFIRPEPDTSDLGWFGGMVDNPFSYSDDVNRFLLFLQITLLPGRFIVQSIRNSIRLLGG